MTFGLLLIFINPALFHVAIAVKYFSRLKWLNLSVFLVERSFLLYSLDIQDVWTISGHVVMGDRTVINTLYFATCSSQ